MIQKMKNGQMHKTIADFSKAPARCSSVIGETDK